MKEKGYAATTKVSIARSRSEIEAVLLKEGAGQVLMGWDEKARSGLVAFTLEGRQFRIRVPAPSGCYSSQQKREQAERQQWRILLLHVKSQLEVVRTGFLSAHDAFLPYTVLPNGEVLGERVHAELDAAYETGSMPKLLPGG